MPRPSPAPAIAALVVAGLAGAASFVGNPPGAGTGFDALPAAGAVPRAGGSAIPEGSELEARLERRISTGSSEPGDRWSGILTHDVTDGARVLLKRGAVVAGVVTHAGPAEVDGVTRQVLAVQPRELHVGERRYEIAAEVVDAERSERDDTVTGEHVALIGDSVAAGGTLGTLLRDVARLDRVLGAAGGTVIAIATQGTVIELREGSTLTVRLTEELKVGGLIPGSRRADAADAGRTPSRRSSAHRRRARSGSVPPRPTDEREEHDDEENLRSPGVHVRASGGRDGPEERATLLLRCVRGAAARRRGMRLRASRVPQPVIRRHEGSAETFPRRGVPTDSRRGPQ